MKHLSLLVTVIVCFFVSFAARAKVTDDRQIRNVGSFSAIKVSTGIDLFLEYGSTEKVTVESDKDDLEYLITEVKDGTLHIYIKKKPFSLNFNNSYEVYVTARKLNSLEASSGSEVKGQNRFQGETCSISASSGSEIKMELNYEKLKLDSSSGSEIKVAGKARQTEVSVSSGSEIDACELEADIVYVEASSGGGACVNASAELHANASSGGDIGYKGSPGTLDVNKSSGGRVSRE